MSHLIIADLAHANELATADMAAVRGGTGYCAPMPACYPAPGVKFYTDPSSFKLDASQMLGQSQNVMNNNGNNVAFASGISSTVNPSQYGTNNITL